MRKAWDDIKSFVTIAMTIAYIILTFLGKITPEYQDLYKFIIIFYFGTQVEKIKQLKTELQRQNMLNNDNNSENNKEIGGLE